MEPIRDRNATFVDLLDRTLDKGLVIHADVIISVAGIPLIGVNLRAAIAGMETMLEYGMMRDWDEAVRAREVTYLKENEPRLSEGEKLLLRVSGTHYYSSGIYTAWRAGYFYLTNKRLFLFRKEPPEVLFETPLEEIRGLRIERKKGDREELCAALKTDEVLRLHVKDVKELKRAIEHEVEGIEFTLQEDITLPELDEKAFEFLTGGEEVTQSGKMWYYAPSDGIMSNTWKPGSLYLTNKRLCWWNNFEEKIVFEIPINRITNAVVEIRDMTTMQKVKKVLVVSHEGGEACFSGNKKQMGEWKKILGCLTKKEMENVLSAAV